MKWLEYLCGMVRDLWNPPCCGTRRWRQCCGRTSEASPPLRWRLRRCLKKREKHNGKDHDERGDIV